MYSRRILARWLAAVTTAAVLAGALWLGSAAVRSVPVPDRVAIARSWPMFGGTPHRNMANPLETGLPATWLVPEDQGARPRNLKWHAALGSRTFGGPVIADGRVFIGTNNENPRDPRHVNPATQRPIDMGVLMCFREADGMFLWQAAHPKLAAGLVNDWPRQGVPSMPAVDGDRLYYVSNRCELICADVASGKAVWRLDMIGRLNVFPHNLSVSSPLVVDDRVFVVTANGVDEGHIDIPAPAAPSFLAVHKRSGKVLWQDNSPTAHLLGVAAQGPQRNLAIRELRKRGKLLLHGQWSNPAYAVVAGRPQVVFPGGDGWLRAFDPESGKLLWKFDCNPKDAEYDLGGRGTRSDFIATPVIYKDRVYIGVGQDPEHNLGVGHLWCIDMTKKGDVSPEIVTNARVWPPKTAKNPNSALVWHLGGPVVDPAERAKLRRNYYFGRTMSTCAIHDDICYAADLNGRLYCLDAETGKVYWTHDGEAQTWSSPYYADGKVYLGNDNGVVQVFAHGKQKKLLAENDMPERIRGVPVAVNGVLYITTEAGLYALCRDR